MRVARELDRQEIGTWIEADEELGALALDHFGQPIGEEGRGDCRLRAHAAEANCRCGRTKRRRAAPAALRSNLTSRPATCRRSSPPASTCYRPRTWARSQPGWSPSGSGCAG